jgi:hypothetical protein
MVVGGWMKDGETGVFIPRQFPTRHDPCKTFEPVMSHLILDI